jgi:hypothetical protein
MILEVSKTVREQHMLEVEADTLQDAVEQMRHTRITDATLVAAPLQAAETRDVLTATWL